jgi:hypothetical protein
MGLRALEDIVGERFVVEYCGEVIDKAECVRRVKQQEAQGHMMFYSIALDANQYVDAAFAGNLARYVNHSCQPNMRVEKWNVMGETRVGFFAVQDISKGTELTIDYQFSTIAGTGLLTAMQKCSCGSERCRGFLGAKVGGDIVTDSIRPEWCEALEVGMSYDARTANGDWRSATLTGMDDRGGITHLQLHFTTDGQDTDEWIAITDISARMAPRGAMTGPEGQKRLAELKRQQDLIDAEEAAKENVRKVRREKAQQRAAERRAERLAAEKAAQELIQKKATLTRKWNSAKLGVCQEECRRRGIWPGGNKSELADRIARAECGEKLSKEERAKITKEQMLQMREKTFTVAKILKHRVSAGRKDEFLVRWKTSTPSEKVADTWEPRSCFAEGCPMLVPFDEFAVDKIATLPYQAAEEPDVPEASRVKTRTYAAQENEQPSRIALKLGTTVEKLVRINLETYPSLLPSSRLKAGTVLSVPSCAKRIWKRSGHGWLGRVVMLPYGRHNLQPNLKKRKKRTTSCSGMHDDQRWLVVAWSARFNGMEPLWRLIKEHTTQEIELLEVEMVEVMTRLTQTSISHGSALQSTSKAEPSKTLPQSTTIVEFGMTGPLESDLDPTDGRWLLIGSQWLGRQVRRTFEQSLDENESLAASAAVSAGNPGGASSIEAIGRVVAYKPEKHGYAAVSLEL